LNDKLAEFSEWWFQEGFSIAHRLCLERIKNGESIDHLTFEHPDVWIAPGVEKNITLQSPTDNRPDPSWDA